MAKSSRGGGDSKPARASGRRRTDKAAANAAPATAPDSLRIKDPEGMSLKDADYAPSPAAVQRRAYELYLRRGKGHGRDLEDWYEAERQLRRQEGKEPPQG